MFTSLFLGAGKLLKMLPLWVWPMLALGAWGYWQKTSADSLAVQVHELEAQWDQEQALDKLRGEANEEMGRMLKAHALRLENERDAKDRATADWLVRELHELRDRPGRLPPAAAAACQGATGKELARGDSEFLAGYAADAERLQSRYDECYAKLESVTQARGVAPSAAASAAGAGWSWTK